MRTCCCCIGVRLGTALTALLHLAVAVIVLVWSAPIAANGLPIEDDTLTKLIALYKTLSESHVLYIVYAVTAAAAISALLNLMLLLSAAIRTRWFIKPWLVWSGLLMVLATLCLLAIFVLALWSVFDEAGARDVLGWQPVDTAFLLKSPLWEKYNETIQQSAAIATAVAAVIGLVAASIFWGFTAAIHGYYDHLYDRRADMMLS